MAKRNCRQDWCNYSDHNGVCKELAKLIMFSLAIMKPLKSACHESDVFF